MAELVDVVDVLAVALGPQRGDGLRRAAGVGVDRLPLGRPGDVVVARAAHRADIGRAGRPGRWPCSVGCHPRPARATRPRPTRVRTAVARDAGRRSSPRSGGVGDGRADQPPGERGRDRRRRRGRASGSGWAWARGSRSVPGVTVGVAVGAGVAVLVGDGVGPIDGSVDDPTVTARTMDGRRGDRRLAGRRRRADRTGRRRRSRVADAPHATTTATTSTSRPAIAMIDRPVARRRDPPSGMVPRLVRWSAPAWSGRARRRIYDHRVPVRRRGRRS